MTTTLILCALLASGLALALSREHRIRRALQDLAARLLDKLCQRSGYAADHHFRDDVQGGADSGALESQNPAQQPSSRARNVSRESAQVSRGQPLVRDPAPPHDPLREKGMGDEGLEPPTPSV